MSKKTKYESSNGVTYELLVRKDDIITMLNIFNPKKPEKPEYLYKFYSINNDSINYTIDALFKKYIFSAHPIILNDKYDCARELIDYSSCSLNFFIDELSSEDFKIFSKEKVEQLYNSSDKWILERTISDFYFEALFGRIGIISLTKNFNNALMWSHYAQNSGFIIKFKTSLLPNKLIGPFPINYLEKLEKIDFSIYDSVLCTLYQSNVKHIDWAYEDEWRYLTYTKDNEYHPFYSSKNLHARKNKYNPEAIEQIIFGYDFFSLNEIDLRGRTSEYDVIDFSSRKHKTLKKLKILKYILKNKIPTFQIIKNTNEYQFSVKEVKFETISTNKFKIFNIYP